MGDIIKGYDTLTIETYDFDKMVLTYEAYCGFYIDTGKLCPLMDEDLKHKYDKHLWYPQNFNVSICIYGCEHFRKIKIPNFLTLKTLNKRGKNNENNI